MNRDLWARRAASILGKKNVCKIQSYLKFLLSFRHYYYSEKITIEPNKKRTAIFFIDGKTIHGGLSDRLRGLFSVYYYCQKRNIEFKVYWVYPFKLQEYLLPNKVNWLIRKEDISYNRNEVAFRFFNSYSFMNDNEKNYFKVLDTTKKILHIYSNVTIHENMYQRFFTDLFRPSEVLNKTLQKCLNEIGDKYISIGFRFISLLGDFEDTYNKFGTLNADEKKEYIEHCINAIIQLHQKHPNINKILVTSDSTLFLSRATELPFVYIIPGAITHIDNANTENSKDSDLKTFLDMLMISKAELCYCYSYKRMFKATKFARTAALIGGRNFIEINE